MPTKKELSAEESIKLLSVLKERFEKNSNRHKRIEWQKIQDKLESMPAKLWSLNEMEKTGGEPDVIGYDLKTKEFIFCDCSSESPKGRRSVCYDQAALDSRKKFKPDNSAIEMAREMGVEILSEEQYHELQKLGKFDAKTSSWLLTSPEIRKLGGAIFGDWRFGRVFIYHNGAESYYGARGFRGILRI
tara:strand:- start:3570 stop:4133 length:564 start_codon:yes stop_codon:yes gene_type:complete